MQPDSEGSCVSPGITKNVGSHTKTAERSDKVSEAKHDASSSQTASPEASPSTAMQPARVTYSPPPQSAGRASPPAGLPPVDGLQRLSATSLSTSGGSEVDRVMRGTSEGGDTLTSSMTSYEPSIADLPLADHGANFLQPGAWVSDDEADLELHDYSTATFLSEPLFVTESVGEDSEARVSGEFGAGEESDLDEEFEEFEGTEKGKAICEAAVAEQPGSLEETDDEVEEEESFEEIDVDDEDTGVLEEADKDSDEESLDELE